MIKFTNKQLEILSNIKEGTPEGNKCSVYDLLELASYECKRDAMLHSIKILVDHGFVERLSPEKRKGRMMTVYNVTSKALDYV